MSRTVIVVGIALLTLLPLVEARETAFGEGLFSRANVHDPFERMHDPFHHIRMMENGAEPAASRGPSLSGNATGNVTVTGNATADDWPQEGSYAKYTMHTIAGRSGRVRESFGNATWTFHGGVWTLDCEGTYDTDQTRRGSMTRWQSGAFARTTHTDDGPPLVTVDDRGGFFQRSPRVEAWRLDGCSVTTFRQSASSDWFSPRVIATWDPDTLLLQSWSMDRGSTMTMGELVATDAPIS